MEMNFKKVHTVTDLVISAVILIAGIVLSFYSLGIGFIVALCGLLMVLFCKGGYKKDGEGVVLKKKSEELCKSSKASVVEFLNGKSAEVTLKQGNEGGCVRLLVYYNKCEKIAYAQLFDFHDYSYQPSMDMVELRGECVDKLLAKL